MSAGLSTTIQIAFTPKIARDYSDIDSSLPLLSETGPINIPLLCTCKKALLEVDNPVVDFGDVIYGEKSVQKVKLTNVGALPTQIYIRTLDGVDFPLMGKEQMEEKREADHKKIVELEVMRYREELETKRKEEEEAKKNAEGEGDGEEQPPPPEEEGEGEKEDPLKAPITDQEL